MHGAGTPCRAILRGGSWLHMPVLVVMAILAIHATAQGQLNGIYTIGPRGDYTTIEAAIAALNSKGVSGPVTFQISRGNYTPPSTGYKLSQVASMSATNTVTFRPGNGATVTIEGSTTTAIFDIDGGDYYILDGSNTAGGTSRDWKIINNSTTGRAIRFINGATRNTVRNMYLIGNHNSTSTGGVVQFSTSSAGGNSFNTVAANTIGDSSGVIRSEVGIATTGSSGANMNDGNIIDDNYIINFGQGSGTGYGMYISSYNKNIKVLRNRITLTQVDGVTGTKYGIYITNAYTGNDTFAYNRIWGLNTSSATTAQYAIRITSQSTTPIVFHHNMISLVADAGTLAGIYASSGDPIHIEHNSIYIGGLNPSASSTSYNIYNTTANSEFRIFNNVLVNQRNSTGSNTNRVFYNSGGTPTIESDNNLFYNNGRSTVMAYNVGTYYPDLPTWQTGTKWDPASVTGQVIFQNANAGDLHVNTSLVFRGEGAGLVLGYSSDIDGDPIDPRNPDIGADEGNFNGGGLSLIAPDGGEKVPVDYILDVRFKANRVMSVGADISVDGGATWQPGGTMTTVRGENVMTIATPDVVTDRALVRVSSRNNAAEADISSSTFSLVLPVFTITTLNSSDRLVPTDTVTIGWTSQFALPTMRMVLEFSDDGGTSWTPIDTNIYSRNLPAENSYKWIVPDIQTSRGILRLRIAGGKINDRSDGILTILPRPSVRLLRPAGGEQLFAGDSYTVEWNAVTTDYVRLTYSTDGGGTWRSMVPNDADLPAYLGSYQWNVPPISSKDVLVSVTNVERSRFGDTLGTSISVLRPALQLLAPNGGERYTIDQPITVRWTSDQAEKLHLQFSANNGASWSTMLQDIDATLGSISFTPPPMPTRTALVRLVDADRSRIVDQSDAVFEIMPAKSITVYAPAAGERFVRGSTTVISWDAPRVDRVMIQYSSNGGNTWQTLVSTMAAAQGNYSWVVPNQITTQGVIRVTEVGNGGVTVGESGIFSVMEPASPALRVITPNGGETYTVGETVPLRWSASGVGTVSLYISTDDGDTWTPIRENIAAAGGTYIWSAVGTPGNSYRIKVASGAMEDISDAPFALRTNALPRLTVLYPNGGERLQAESSVELRWTAENMTGDLELEYSTDGGTSWKPIATVAAGTGLFAWKVPDDTSSRALLRVRTSDRGVSDISDAPWSIFKAVPEPFLVLRPNGGEVWKVGTREEIRWSAPETVATVDIHYSTDGGISWQPVAAGVQSAGGARTYSWSLPTLSSTITGALVRVSNSAAPDQQDVSDDPFTIDAVATVTASTGESGARLLGVFPNPFTTQTEIRWIQHSAKGATLRLYEQSGRSIAEIDLGYREAGEQRYLLSSEALPSGSYMYELMIGGTALRGAMVVTR